MPPRRSTAATSRSPESAFLAALSIHGTTRANQAAFRAVARQWIAQL